MGKFVTFSEHSKARSVSASEGLSSSPLIPQPGALSLSLDPVGDSASRPSIIRASHFFGGLQLSNAGAGHHDPYWRQ